MGQAKAAPTTKDPENFPRMVPKPPKRISSPGSNAYVTQTVLPISELIRSLRRLLCRIPMAKPTIAPTKAPIGAADHSKWPSSTSQQHAQATAAPIRKPSKCQTLCQGAASMVSAQSQLPLHRSYTRVDRTPCWTLVPHVSKIPLLLHHEITCIITHQEQMPPLSRSGD